MTALRLHLDDDDLAACVSCGLCLPHCPTYRVTGEESASPRGRIAAMRSVHFEGASIDDQFVSFMSACVQCRGCESACPSGVRYGRLMEGTRDALVETGRLTPRWQRLAYRALGHHHFLLAGSTALAIAQRARVVPKRLGLPRLPMRRPTPLRPSGVDVWFFTGCVMDAWQRDTHHAAKRVVEATGAGVALPGPGGACCGALHVHAGLTGDARKLAKRVMASMPGPAPILVDSAGCGAALKDYGHLLQTAEAREFSARVRDVHEWLAERVELLPPPAHRIDRVVAVQDPCHLRHVQHAHLPVRTVLDAAGIAFVELDDEGLCCGAGGAYSALQPGLATAIRDRKLASIARSGATVVASANPGCAMHLAAAGLTLRHPLELVDEALHGLR
ncbi:MAG TPA: heterodisulfide reductase-related iron-sulfur binding cluster [Acidimicrobiales bacterium]